VNTCSPQSTSGRNASGTRSPPPYAPASSWWGGVGHSGSDIKVLAEAAAIYNLICTAARMYQTSLTPTEGKSIHSPTTSIWWRQTWIVLWWSQIREDWVLGDVPGEEVGER
jgi:hypothetical protein